MSYRDPTYVIFDGDKDIWAYGFMKGWKLSDRIDFDFRDAHDLDTMTSRAQSEEYVKRQLRARMEQARAVIVLIGESTRNLYRFVRWELELALSLGKPIIAVNLNGSRQLDVERCPPILRDECVVHVDFKMRIIKHALDNWPGEYGRLGYETKSQGARSYSAAVYRDLGL